MGYVRGEARVGYVVLGPPGICTGIGTSQSSGVGVRPKRGTCKSMGGFSRGSSTESRHCLPMPGAQRHTDGRRQSRWRQGGLARRLRRAWI